MKIFSILSVACVALAAAAPFASASADSTEAMCEVRKDGKLRQGATGPCTFSQRQGYVELGLRNGDRISLAPGKNAGHYKDPNGRKVVRTSSGSSEVFKWEGSTKITVTFVSTPSTHHQGASNYRAGDTAPDLADLIGARAGQAEGELELRGYTYATG